MFRPQVYRFHEPEHALVAAGMALHRELLRARNANVMLASGNTMQGVYAALKQCQGLGGSYSRDLEFFHLDEFLSASANALFGEELQEKLIAPLSLGKLNRWPHNQREAVELIPKQTLALRARDLAVCLLGIGVNGHIGFNEPGSELDSGARVVKLSEISRKNLSDRFGGLEAVPENAVSWGINDILRAQKIILVATGEAKSEAIAKFIAGPIDPACPASFLRFHENVEIYCDDKSLLDLDQRPDLFTPEPRVLATSEKIEGNILFLSPHPDDTAIGAGGFLTRHGSSNKIRTLNLFSGHRSEIPGTDLEQRIRIRAEESREEARILGVQEFFAKLDAYDDLYKPSQQDIGTLRDFINGDRPKHIFLPSPKDPHPAHRSVFSLLRTALSGSEKHGPLYLWFYETPWALFEPGLMNVIVPLAASETTTKLKAIGAHRSQVARLPYDYSAEALARFRAIVSREQELAEYGKIGPDLGKHAECFACFKIR